MKLVIRGRRGGKTTELIRMCAEQGGYIVCPGREDAERIFRRAKELGLSIHFPLTADEWARCDYRLTGVRQLFFDDLDRIVRARSTVPVVAATWTADGEAAGPPSSDT